MTAARTDDGRIWTRRTTVKWRTIDGETVVLDTEQSKYLLLNDTATTLWAALDDGASEGDLVAALTAKYDVAPATAAHDVATFLNDCQSRGWLV